MEYTDDIAVFERILLYNRIQDIKAKQAKAEEEHINQIKANQGKVQR